MDDRDIRELMAINNYYLLNIHFHIQKQITKKQIYIYIYIL